MTITIEQFLRGEPVAYTGFNGKPYIATWKPNTRDLGIGCLRIVRGKGGIFKSYSAGEIEARNFFNNLHVEREN